MRNSAGFCNWPWIAGIYLAEGLPYSIVTVVAVITFKNLGIGNESTLFWTSLFSLPWILKPLWSPVIDLFGRKRSWIVGCQIAMGLFFLLIGWLLHDPATRMWALALFFAVAATAATHDAAADGFYILALPGHEQAFYSGLRSAFYKIASMIGQGGLVVLVGFLLRTTGCSPETGWLIGFGAAGAIFLIIALYCQLVLPNVQLDRPTRRENGRSASFFGVFRDFFLRRDVGKLIFVLLFYRLGESQLRVAMPFLLAGKADGGMALDNQTIGSVYGTGGVVALTLGGILARVLVSRYGMGKLLWPMVLALNLPDFVYVYLSFHTETGLVLLTSGIFLEQFGYGFGLTGLMLFMVCFAARENRNQTSHYALMTGLMSLGLMVPGMLSGYLLERFPILLDGILSWNKYQIFFLWVILCTIPGFVAAAVAGSITPSDYGKKQPQTVPENSSNS